MRLRVLIGVAVVLAVALAVRLLFFGGEDGDDGDPTFAQVEKHRREGNAAALGRAVSHSNVEVARRAVEALGRLGPKALPRIKEATADPRPRVRQRAATVLSRVGSHKDAPTLSKLVRQDNSADVRAAAVSGLSYMYAFDEMEAILAAMEDPDVAVRRRASVAATRIACLNVGFKADDPPAKRKAAVQRMRAAWARDKDRARERWRLILKQRKRGDAKGG